jgi:hypothetical protein
MKNAHARAAALAFALIFAASAAQAQRPPDQQDPNARPAATQTNVPKPPPAPSIVKAKYEGGILGYRKQDGWLSFDDLNRRLVFLNKDRREQFSISFDAILAAWPDTKSQTSTAGQIISRTAPYGLGLPALLMRSKSRYLVLQYRDPDTSAEGVTSFKIETREMVASVITTLAEKAQLVERGEAYVRRREANTNTTTPTNTKTSAP